MPEAETINLLCLVVIRQGLLMQNKFPKIRDTPEAGDLKVDYMQQCNMSPSFPLLIQSCPNYKNPRWSQAETEDGHSKCKHGFLGPFLTDEFMPFVFVYL